MGAWRTGRCRGLDGLRTHPHYPLLPLTFREDKNGPLLQREKTEGRKNKEKKAGPSFHDSKSWIRESRGEGRGERGEGRGNVILKSIGGSEEGLLFHQCMALILF